MKWFLIYFICSSLFNWYTYSKINEEEPSPKWYELVANGLACNLLVWWIIPSVFIAKGFYALANDIVDGIKYLYNKLISSFHREPIEDEIDLESIINDAIEFNKQEYVKLYKKGKMK